MENMHTDIRVQRSNVKKWFHSYLSIDFFFSVEGVEKPNDAFSDRAVTRGVTGSNTPSFLLLLAALFRRG